MQVESFSDLITRAIDAAPAAPAAFADWWTQILDSGGSNPAVAVLSGLLIAFVAFGIDRGVCALAGRLQRSSVDYDRTDLSRALRWIAGRAIAITIFILSCDALLAGFSTAGSADRMIASIVIDSLIGLRLFLSAFAFLARPDARSIDDQDRRVLLCSPILPLSVATFVLSLRGLLALGIGPRDEVLAPGLILTVVLSLSLAWALFSVRRPVSKTITAIFSEEDRINPIAKTFADFWHAIYAVFFLFSDLMTFPAELGLSGADPVPAFSVIFVAAVPIVIAGIRSWTRRRSRSDDVKSESVAIGLAALAEGLVVFVAALLLLDAWGIDAFAAEDASGLDRIVSGIVSAMLALIVGLAIARTVAALIDIHKPEELDPTKPLDEEAAPADSSRFATVYPVFRGAALTAVYAITAMTALSALGVPIGPLIASAGVVGLAISFGAQSLVNDILNGFFYLQADAFRIGEYIVTAEGKGVVERISLTSVRLRHHRGAVYTIPFGTVGTVENHSRDWVKVKFSIEVPASEDLERVRKLIKRVGEELQEDPQIGSLFLEPLKSQGALSMKGPNYEIGIKFSTRPGQQFLIRRKAFVALQKTFEERGVKLPQAKVVVESDLPSETSGAAASATLPQT